MPADFPSSFTQLFCCLSRDHLTHHRVAVYGSSSDGKKDFVKDDTLALSLEEQGQDLDRCREKEISVTREGAHTHKEENACSMFIAPGQQAVHRGTMGNMVDHENQERLELRLW